MKNRWKISAALAGVSLLIGLPMAAADNPTDPAIPQNDAIVAPDTSMDPVPTVTDGSNYKGDPQNEAAMVAAEDKRLVQVRTVSSIARWAGTKLNVPYRVSSGTGYTLVLPARATDYTIDDLLTLAPKTFVLQPDGSYLLSENLVVESGATLTLTRPAALALNLLSTAKKFVSIVNYGGKLNISGTPDAPVKISSWDTDTGAPRRITDSGRAYVRSIGGTATIEHAIFQSLGFWSGRTGGLSMTGTDRPIVGALNQSGAKAKYIKPAAPSKKHPADPAAPPAAPAPAPAPALSPGETLPAQPGSAPDFSYASAAVQDITVTDNVYGLFLANAVGISIHNAIVQNSRMDGIVLHRFVSNAVIANSTVRSSALNGFMVSRAASDIHLDTDTAVANQRDGIYVDGRALATGPSATGTTLTAYGNNTVSNSMITANSRYGIEVRGGRNTTVRANTISGGLSGIVADAAASTVTISGNHLDGGSTQAIALRDGVTASTVENNTVSGGAVGIYLRNAAATVQGNVVDGVTNHGISAIGSGVIRISANTLSGAGPSPVDLKRTSNAVAENNTTDNWTLTRSFWQNLTTFFQPLTIVWTMLALILILTAFAGHRHRGAVKHPYAAQAPMSAFTDLEPILIQPNALTPALVQAAHGDFPTPADKRRGTRRRRKTTKGPGQLQPPERESISRGAS
ncbi:right-handed parallel beta-helix repeat-containing protein [Pseudarthrobacter sp. NPDC080039]|uniref:right-handed parallel beta-helix repeat-containing protein n=1 Tax=unclassified Pseudarthrobacter TaxID=2647000 RepID=UPI003450210B